MRKVIATAAAAAIVALSGNAVRADQPAPRTISVSGTGSVHYSPDIARISLGVRGESPTAAAAAKSVNSRAASVIDALRALGIADANITTSGYSIEYQPPPQSDQQPMPPPPPGQVQPMSIIRRPPAHGTYVATETIDVKTSITKAGAVLDGAVTAGANETYGLTFDTSQRQEFSRQALGRAVADARAQAEILAKAAGVEIAGLQSINVGGGAPQPMFRAVMMSASVQPPVMGGTGTIEVSVDVIYRIK
jgi:uncharacterized protein YggE